VGHRASAPGQTPSRPWPVAKVEVGRLIGSFGRETDGRNPHLPFLALQASGQWELTAEEPERGRSSNDRLHWLNNTEPGIRGGFSQHVHELITGDDEAAATVVHALLQNYFSEGDVRPERLLEAVGLSDLMTASRSDARSSHPRRSGRSGRIADAARRAAVEQHAVDRATAHCREHAYQVTDVGTVECYDLRAVKNGEELHVEVKGSIGIADYVELTVNEVTHAEGALTDLVVVDGIRLEQRPDGTFTTSGGRLRHWPSWQLAYSDLSPKRYQYRLPRD
jgi:Protein NO VEIN, C-terminal